MSTNATYGHIGEDPGYTSILAVDPKHHLAAALLVLDRQPFDAVGAMQNLLIALH